MKGYEAMAANKIGGFVGSVPAGASGSIVAVGRWSKKAWLPHYRNMAATNRMKIGMG